MTDPITLIAAADPAAEQIPDPAAAARMDAELARLLAVPTRRATNRRRWIAIPLVGAAAAAAVVAFAPSSKHAPIRVVPANAAQFLGELQAKAAQATPAEGRYAYERSLAYISHMRPRKGGHGSYVMVVPHEFEQWVAADGSGVTREVMHEDQATFPTPRDKADWEAASPPPEPWDDSPRAVPHVSIAGMSIEDVRALPTDPEALKAKLTQGNVSLTAWCGLLLGSPATPQAVKVALFSVLKAVPGAQLENGVKDPMGRTGVAVEFDDPAWHTVFLFDPETGQLLGTRSIGHKELPGRDIDDWNLVLDAKRVDSAPATSH